MLAYALCLYAQCCCADHNSECHYVKYPNTECSFPDCHNAECHYAECIYA